MKGGSMGGRAQGRDSRKKKYIFRADCKSKEKNIKIK
jgi:hypothetical protein